MLFVDLIFYHRVLKYHVLIELKTNEVKLSILQDFIQHELAQMQS